jgi:hypothetical protein
MDDARCARFLRDIPGVTERMGSVLSDEEIRASVASEAAFFRRVGARAAVTGFTLSALLSTRVAEIPLGHRARRLVGG